MVEVTLEPYRSWKKVQTRPGYDIVWKCEAGWLFARVEDRTVAHYLFDLYGALTANAVPWGSGAAPTPGSVYPYTIIQDANVPPRRILRHNHKSMLWEVFPSLNHPTALFYLRTPQSQFRGAMTNEMGNPNPNFSNPFGYWFEGVDSDIEAPTEAARFFIPPDRDTEIAIVNVENYEIRPQTLFVLNQLQITPFDPATKFGADAIARILGKSPSRMTMATTDLAPYAYSAEEFENWFGVKPVKWDGHQATYTPTGGVAKVVAEVR